MSIVNVAKLGSLQSTSEFYITSGTFSVGAGEVRVNPTTTGTGYVGINGIAADGTSVALALADAYASFYFRVAALPTANHEIIASAVSSGGTNKLRVAINSAGQLLLIDVTGATVDTGSTVLATDGTWYQIELRAGNGTTAAYELRIDGTTELSGTANQGGTDFGGMYFGKTVNLNGESVDFYYKNYVLDDAAFIGPYDIVTALPTSDGSTQAWTSGTGASDYTQVDEVPDSTADYVQSPASGGEVALFGFDSAATLGVSGTIHAVMAIARLRLITGTASTTIRIHSGSSDADTSAYATTISTLTRRKLALVDPATSAAWTTSGIDGMEAGAVEANAVATRLTTLQALVVFTAGGGGAVELVVADMSSATSLDAPALTQANVLAAADLAAAATLDGAVLTQAHVLSADALDVVTALDGVALTQAHALVVAGLDAATALDAVALTQAHALVAAGLDVATTIDAVALTQANVLSVDPLTGATSLDAVVLVQAHILVAAGLDVATTLDAPTLDVSVLLVVADMSGGTTLDPATLTQANVLAVVDLTAATSLDSPALTQAGTLTAGDLLCVTTLDGVVLVIPQDILPADNDITYSVPRAWSTYAEPRTWSTYATPRSWKSQPEA